MFRSEGIKSLAVGFITYFLVTTIYCILDENMLQNMLKVKSYRKGGKIGEYKKQQTINYDKFHFINYLHNIG
ncbi:hypothetical protein SAMN05446037_100874 [Anaerovirgula multivorans]|uniref:Uncharacterized protein n=1 Tax=Anaerovirgula multivorans TaxID=312168 RepID=A0A239DPP9_9FIRM|nr:hypothetical protein [Anaerovirgula multivorans]SNS34307.1 hypothetical protein SAMN05446037_100874 [Anaerovirgula multivorans]